MSLRWRCQAAISRFLEDEVTTAVRIRVQPGVLKESDSRLELGLQAADVGAAVASKLYEEAADSGPTSRALAVKSVFSRVCFNNDWL